MKHLNHWNYYQLYCLQDNMLLLLFSNWFYGQMSDNTVHHSSIGHCIHYTEKATTSCWKMPKWLFWQVPEETGTLAFAAAAELAAAVAEALNTVCGTRRGMSGTSLLPSAAHSAQLPAPWILQNLIENQISQDPLIGILFVLEVHFTRLRKSWICRSMQHANVQLHVPVYRPWRPYRKTQFKSWGWKVNLLCSWGRHYAFILNGYSANTRTVWWLFWYMSWWTVD